jgi:hypothetical protein
MVTNPNTPNTPSAEQIAKQFEVTALEPRLEMNMPYGHDTENPTPSVPTGLEQ